MKKIIPLFILAIILLSSCLTKIALKSLGVFEKSVSVKYISNDKKQIVFLPMHHIGTKEFYDDETRLVDSLLQNGYTVFYENLKKGNTSQLVEDTLFMKFRRITGIPRNSKDKLSSRIDTVTNTLMGKKSKLVAKYKLRNQEIAYLTKYDSLKVKNIDGTIEEMVLLYEKKYGVVMLEKNDFETKLREPYSHSEGKVKRNYFLIDTRNIIITNEILQSKANKIAIVYGAGHYTGILKNLQDADKTYRAVDKF